MNICPECGKRLSRESSLYRHIREVHKIPCRKRNCSSVKVFKCLECEKAFSCQNSLYRHRKQHDVNSEDKPAYICFICDSSFQSRKKIIWHLRTIHKTENDRNRKERTQIISRMLPWNYNYKIVTNANLTSVIEFDVAKPYVEAANQWIKQFEEKNKVFFRRDTVHPSKKECVIFKARLHCGHFIRTQKNKISKSARQTYCPFRLGISISCRDSRSVAKVRITGEHNHVIGSAHSLKYRPVSKVVKDKMFLLFNTGCSPAKAYQQHLKDLREEYGDNFYKVQVDGYLCPNIRWMYHFHDSIYKNARAVKKEFSIKMLQRLKQKSESRISFIKKEQQS